MCSMNIFFKHLNVLSIEFFESYRALCVKSINFQQFLKHEQDSVYGVSAYISKVDINKLPDQCSPNHLMAQ